MINQKHMAINQDGGDGIEHWMDDLENMGWSTT